MDRRTFIEKTLRQSGELVMASFGEIIPSQRKIEKSQIVTEVDVASERLIIEAITKMFPQSGILAEESGFISAKDDTYFIIDPIDGTSNYANGLPWFGVMIAYIEKGTVAASGMYLPQTDEMYLAEKGKGAYKNGQQMKKPRDIRLDESLISFCFSFDDSHSAEKEATIIKRLGPKVLNLRSTNSAYDYAYAADGKLAATINFKNKIWDVAPIILFANEAGYTVLETTGNPHSMFSLDENTSMKNYTIVIANPSIVDDILPLLT